MWWNNAMPIRSVDVDRIANTVQKHEPTVTVSLKEYEELKNKKTWMEEFSDIFNSEEFSENGTKSFFIELSNGNEQKKVEIKITIIK